MSDHEILSANEILRLARESGMGILGGFSNSTLALARAVERTVLERVTAPSAEPVAKVRCACGDIYPADSYGAGYIDAAGRCPNCDNAPLAPSAEPVGVTIQERIARLEQDPKRKAALDRARERLARAGVGAQSQPFWNDWPGVIKQTHELLPKGSREAMRQALDALVPLMNAHSPGERELLTDEQVIAAGDAVVALEKALGEKE